MNRSLALALLLTIPLALPGCGGGEKDHKDHSHKDHDHKDHSHKDETVKDAAAKDKAGHKHEGERFDLGSREIETYVVKAAQIGKITKGEGVLELKVSGLANGTVRVWAGTKDAKGAVKAQAEYSPDHDEYEVHVEVSDSLPADAKWWIELDPTGGDKAAVSFDIKK